MKEETTCQKLLAYGRRSKNLSSASLCTFQLGNREVNSSEVINVGNLSETALCCKENKGLVQTPPSVALRSVVLKPSFMKKRVGDASFAANNKELKPRGASPRTTLLFHTPDLKTNFMIVWKEFFTRKGKASLPPILFAPSGRMIGCP